MLPFSWLEAGRLASVTSNQWLSHLSDFRYLYIYIEPTAPRGTHTYLKLQQIFSETMFSLTVHGGLIYFLGFLKFRINIP